MMKIDQPEARSVAASVTFDLLKMLNDPVGKENDAFDASGMLRDIAFILGVDEFLVDDVCTIWDLKEIDPNVNAAAEVAA